MIKKNKKSVIIKGGIMVTRISPQKKKYIWIK